MNKLGDIATVSIAVMGFLAFIGGLIAWFYRRGGQERALADALDENTKSNREVAKELKDFKAETLATLRDHDWRLKILEDKKNA